MAKAKRHVHKYHYINLPIMGKVWACRLPDCNHYMPKHLEPTVEGKNSICWECGEAFTLDSEAMKEEKPRCENCRGVKEDAAALQEYLAKLENDRREERIRALREYREGNIEDTVEEITEDSETESEE